MKILRARLAAAQAAVAITVAILAGTVACATEAPPQPDTADAIHFGTPSQPTYLSVDGRTTIFFNPLMNIMAVAVAPAAPDSGKDIDTSCSMPGQPCMNILGLSLSEPPHMGNAVAPHWTVGGARFEIVGCVREYQHKCFTHLISVVGRDGKQGWYVYSMKRGVELFARKGDGASYDEVFVLTADVGVLQAGAN